MGTAPTVRRVCRLDITLAADAQPAVPAGLAVRLLRVFDALLRPLLDMPRARLACAEPQAMNRRFCEALRSAQAAVAGLPKGSPDWLRAQDIELQARAELERQDKRR